MDSETHVVIKTLKDNSAHPMFNVAGPPPPPPPPLHGVSSTENGSDYAAEISIFEAQKYFSEECNESKGSKRLQPSHHDQRLPPPPPPPSSSSISYAKSFRATPTAASSEASWNSRMGLLANPLGSTRVSLASLRARKRWSAAKKWFLRRNCCCRADKSVSVKEGTTKDGDQRVITQTTSESLQPKCSISDNVVQIHRIKAMAPNTAAAASSSMDAPRKQRISATGRPFIEGAVAFTFPILNSDQAIIKPAINYNMEAFQPPPPPRRPFHPGSPAAREDDVASDASSDLFEIESFSTQATSCAMHGWWDTVDEVSICARKSAAENGVTSVQNCRRSGDEASAAQPSIAANYQCDPAGEVGSDCKVCITAATVDGCDRDSAPDFSAVATSEVSVATLWPPREDAGGGEDKSTDGNGIGNGLTVMNFRQEKKAAAVKCMAEEPPVIPLHVGGSPPRPRSHTPPLPVA